MDTEKIRVPAPTGSPVKSAAIIIYATLLLLVLTIPQSVVNWLQGFNPNPTQQILLAGAQSLRGAIRLTGVDVPYRAARSTFLRLTNKELD